jgi:hypothetical protein
MGNLKTYKLINTEFLHWSFCKQCYRCYYKIFKLINKIVICPAGNIMRLFVMIFTYF